MTTTSNTAAKKPKPEDDDFDLLRQYILACPQLNRDNPAVKAALAGMDNELQRRERDAKLQKKFAQQTSTAAANGTASGSSANTDEDDMIDEWQDVAGDQSKDTALLTTNGSAEDVEIIENSTMEDDSSFLGKVLSETAIAAMAEFQAKARTPLASIAMALHAAMRSDVVGFACTGIPVETSKGGGFAAPIRELRKTQFLPPDWDKHASQQDKTDLRVVLRYRKNGTGSVVLSVQQKVEGAQLMVTVKLAQTTEPAEPQQLTFALDEHMNLDSWNAACKGSFGIQPALHYKRLSALMTKFAATFDLGAIRDDDKQGAAVTADGSVPSGTQPFVNNLPPPPTGHHHPNTGNRPSFPPPVVVGNPARPYDDRGPTIGSAFPQPHRPMVGDFAGDLGPSGAAPFDPLRIGGSPDNMGNLMGPNHPSFGGHPSSSGFGMKPRFDPFGPPGGPTDIAPLPGQAGKFPPGARRPGGSGNPNNDLARPPNSLGNNHMFL